MLDKNKISKPFATNNIEKQQRQRRDTEDWSDKDNNFDNAGKFVMLQLRTENCTNCVDYK